VCKGMSIVRPNAEGQGLPCWHVRSVSSFNRTTVHSTSYTTPTSYTTSTFKPWGAANTAHAAPALPQRDPHGIFLVHGVRASYFLRSQGGTLLPSHSTPRHSATHHNITQHRAAQHSTAQHSTAQHSTAQHSTAQHSTAQHISVQRSAPQHSTAQRTAAQHSAAHRSTAQRSAPQHSTAQHSTVANITQSLHAPDFPGSLVAVHDGAGGVNEILPLLPSGRLVALALTA
jgi:hypothetical protein